MHAQESFSSITILGESFYLQPFLFYLESVLWVGVFSVSGSLKPFTVGGRLPLAKRRASIVKYHYHFDQQIGAGTSLPGVVASLCGADVILTDKEEYPECLENCQRSCDANGQKSVKVIGITWGQFTPNIFKLPKADIIIGSDCFYDTKGTLALEKDLSSVGQSFVVSCYALIFCDIDFDDILATVSFLIERNMNKAKFWTTYQERRY